jgi:hypothetical protein
VISRSSGGRIGSSICGSSSEVWHSNLRFFEIRFGMVAADEEKALSYTRVNSCYQTAISQTHSLLVRQFWRFVEGVALCAAIDEH